MARSGPKTRKLEEWILTEAYKNGQARRGGICSTGSNAAEDPEGYYVSRYAVYQRFFKLPIDAFFQGGTGTAQARRSVASRLRCAAALCQSVRTLLRDGLIHVPCRASQTAGQADRSENAATLICLTAAGARKAESLLGPAPDPKVPVAATDMACVLSTP